MDISKVMSMVDDVKEKLKDAEYKNIVDELAKQKEKEEQYYKIKYLKIFTTNGYIDSCCGDQATPNVNFSSMTAYFRGVNPSLVFNPRDGTCKRDIDCDGEDDPSWMGEVVSGDIVDACEGDADPKAVEQYMLLSVKKSKHYLH
jgi:hypothetical protein